MKKFTLEDDLNDVVWEFSGIVHSDKQISSLVKQLKKRYHELEKQSGFDKLMKDEESAEFISDTLDQHTEEIDPNETDIFTYLWYNA